MSDSLVNVVIAPHPLKHNITQCTVQEGATLAELGAGSDVQAVVDGDVITDLSYKPHAGQIVVLQRVLHGSNKDIGRLIASIAVIVIASYVAGPAGFGTATKMNMAAFAAVSLVGQLAVSALIPPPEPNFDQLPHFEPFQTLTGTRNRVALFEPVPKLYGQHRIFPAYAVRPQPFREGAIDFLNLLFCVGYRPLDIDAASFKIGETLISEYEGITYEIVDGFKHSDPITIISTDVVTNSLNVALNTFNDSVIRTTPVNTKKATFDITGVLGMYDDQASGRPDVVAGFKFEYRAAGTADPFVQLQPTVRGDGGVADNFPFGVEFTKVYGKVVGVNPYQPPGLLTIDDRLGDVIAATYTRSGLTVTVAAPAHGLQSGNYVRADFTSGDIPDGNYPVLPTGLTADAFTFLVQSGTSVSGNVSISRTDGRLLGSVESSVNQLTFPTDGPAAFMRGTVDRVTHAAFTLTFPTNGQWDVKITRLHWFSGPTKPRSQFIQRFNVYTDGAEGVGSAHVLKDMNLFREQFSSGAGIVLNDKYAYIALQIKASNQLTKIVDEFSCVAKSVLHTSSGTYSRSGTTVTCDLAGHSRVTGDWVKLAFTSGAATSGVYQVTVLDADTFTVVDAASGVTSGAFDFHVPTANPAWVYRDILRGPATRRPIALSKIDTPALEAWAARNEANGREFNGIFDARLTMHEALRAVASTGRAAFSKPDGKFSIVEDRPGLTPVQMFTPRNMWDFEASRNFPRLPNALKVKFKNRDIVWEEDERIVYDDGFSFTGAACEVPGQGGSCAVATRFESSSMFGVTHKDQVWKDTRFMIASGKLRGETFTWKCASENLLALRGDVVRLQHDAVLVGLGSGRILSATNTSITCDEEFTLEVGKTYQVIIRDRNNVSLERTLTNAAGTTKTLTFVAAIIVADVVGALAGVGETGLVTLDVLITGIRPEDELTAQITAIPYSSPAVHNADGGSIPAYEPNISEEITTPRALLIKQVTAVKGVGEPTSSGGFTTGVLLTYVVDPAEKATVLHVEAQYRKTAPYETEWVPNEVATHVGFVRFTGLDEKANHDFRIRAIANGGPGPWTEILDQSLTDATVYDYDSVLALSEEVNTPAAPDGRTSTVAVTITPPDPAPNYDHTLVEYRKQGTDGWIEGGRDAAAVRVPLTADGATYEFRAWTVNKDGAASLDKDSVYTITLKNLVGAPPNASHIATYLPASAVTNLKLANAAGTSFVGRDAVFEWDNGAVPTYLHFKDYRVRIYRSSDMVLLRTEYVTAARYTYTGEMNAQDNGGTPVRGLTIDVVQRTLQDNVGG